MSAAPVDPACTATLAGCGVGLGQIDPPDLDDSPVPAIRQVCQAGGALVVDIDGDGALESFALAAFARQDEEIPGAGHRGACAEPAFARARLDDRLDLLGAADLDGDGRAEIVLQLRSARKTRWLVYSPGQAAARLERVAAVEVSGGALP